MPVGLTLYLWERLQPRTPAKPVPDTALHSSRVNPLPQGKRLALGLGCKLSWERPCVAKGLHRSPGHLEGPVHPHDNAQELAAFFTKNSRITRIQRFEHLVTALLDQLP